MSPSCSSTLIRSPPLPPASPSSSSVSSPARVRRPPSGPSSSASCCSSAHGGLRLLVRLLGHDVGVVVGLDLVAHAVSPWFWVLPGARWPGGGCPGLPFLRCWRVCFFGCCRAAGFGGSGGSSTATGPAARAPGRTSCPWRRRAPAWPGERRRPGSRVVADHVELLAHRPQVGGGPVEEHADRERDAADGEDDRAARRAASSAAGRTGRSARRRACSCSSAGAG